MSWVESLCSYGVLVPYVELKIWLAPFRFWWLYFSPFFPNLICQVPTNPLSLRIRCALRLRRGIPLDVVCGTFPKIFGTKCLEVSLDGPWTSRRLNSCCYTSATACDDPPNCDNSCFISKLKKISVAMVLATLALISSWSVPLDFNIQWHSSLLSWRILSFIFPRHTFS